MSWLDFAGRMVVDGATRSRGRRGRAPDAADFEPPSFTALLMVALVAVGVVAVMHGEPLVGGGIVSAQALVMGYLFLRANLGQKKRDADHVARITQKAGMRLAGPGEFDLYRLPFPVFRQGEWQGFDHAYIGQWGDDTVWAFDYWYGFDVKGNDVEEHFTCAAMRISADCPKLSVGRENPWSRTWGHLGWRDIEVESEDFNRRFDVSGDDRTFAFAFLTPSMIEWLQATPAQFEFAVEGEWLLCRSKWLPTKRWWDLLRMIRDFRGRLPRNLERLYPLDAGPRQAAG